MVWSTPYDHIMYNTFVRYIDEVALLFPATLSVLLFVYIMVSDRDSLYFIFRRTVSLVSS